MVVDLCVHKNIERGKNFVGCHTYKICGKSDSCSDDVHDDSSSFDNTFTFEDVQLNQNKTDILRILRFLMCKDSTSTLTRKMKWADETANECRVHERGTIKIFNRFDIFSTSSRFQFHTRNINLLIFKLSETSRMNKHHKIT